MSKKNFISIVKNASCWKIDKKRGDYIIPNGLMLTDYLCFLIQEILEKYNLIIRESGRIGKGIKNSLEQALRAKMMAYEIVGGR